MAVRGTIGPDSSHAYAMSSISEPVLPIVNATYLTLAPHSPIALFTGFHLSFHPGRPSATHPLPSLSCSPHPHTFHSIRTLFTAVRRRRCSGFHDGIEHWNHARTEICGRYVPGISGGAQPPRPSITRPLMFIPPGTLIAKMHEIPLAAT
jgi:hypothetical protein